VRLCKLLDDGRRQICAFATAGDLFGVEFGGTHGFSAEAVCDAMVVSYRRGRLDALSSGSGHAVGELLAFALEGLERAQRHMLLLGRKSALEKVASFLCDMAERADIDAIDLSMSRTDIADYLGLTIETVSRTLTQLEREHIIELPATRRSIVLRNKVRLRRLCE
jgi:CRP/FNR family transcriptional regulator, nitrogen fixation regulation protein